MNDITFSITPSVIREAQQYGLPPLIYVLVQSTGTLWRISECGTAVEVVAPFRTFVLKDRPLQLWRRYCQTGTVPPHACEVQCYSLLEADTGVSRAA